MDNDTYNDPILVEMHGAIVRVYHPILTDSERSKRKKAIHDAAAELLKKMQSEKKSN